MQPNENGTALVRFSMNPAPVLANTFCAVSLEAFPCYANEFENPLGPWGDFVAYNEDYNFVRFAVGKYEGGEEFFTLKFKGKELPVKHFCNIDPNAPCGLWDEPNDDEYYDYGSSGVGLGGSLV